uniref:Ankyrin repeat and SOCS box containing 16 n=1 Tax=Cavia porcellus TaxID=10141 RepID=A0A286XZQ2_CAVPO
MARHNFLFTASALRGIRLQREWLEWEDWRQAVARRRCRSHKNPAKACARLLGPRHRCRDPTVHSALFDGDLQRVQALFQDEEAANGIMATVSNQLAWSAEQGFWVLTPKTKQTVPLAIAVARGYTDCGAELDARVGGQAALHEACAHCQSHCVWLLLAFGATANVLSEEGAAPLHLCTTPESLECAKLLLDAGATVNLAAGDEATPLHVAAACGLEAHVALYLARGVSVELRTGCGETALNVACVGAEPGAAGLHEAAARRLATCLLHHACAHGHSRLTELLLRHGARTWDPNALQAASDAAEPKELLAALLDYGAEPVHPEMWMMLKHCANLPRALEVLLNAYPCVPSCDPDLASLLPAQEHQAFYSSALHMVNQPCRLQHLASLAVCTRLGDHCHEATALLPLPPVLWDYLLLSVEGHIE